MRLHFPWNEIKKALQEVETGEKLRQSDFLPHEKGLWLVGDQGIYIMPNTMDGHYNDAREENRPFVVYAEECNPEKLDFEIWRENKRKSFGGDDGVEFIRTEAIENLLADPSKLGHVPDYLIVEITPKLFFLRIAWKSGDQA